jgi:predicted dehydrogenase
MGRYSVAVVGAGEPEVGRDVSQVSKEGFSVAYRHAPVYRERDDCELVAVADVVPEHAEAFAEQFDLPAGNAYTDYQEMLADLDLDVVDVCTPAPTHADIVVGAATSGDLEAIHCEKPMARTYGQCTEMAQVCERRDVQLTINHQRRFGTPWRRAKELLDDGEVGDLQRIEFGSGSMYSMGTHHVDLAGFLNDDHAAEWVIGQVDYRTENIFSSGAHNENQSLATWQYENGVYGLAANGVGAEMVNAFHRVVGTDGVIEVAPRGEPGEDLPILRIRRAADEEWEAVEAGDGGTGGGGNDYPYMSRAIGSAIEALSEGREPELGARNALKTAEIIFGTYESARKRGRVDFPLEIDDNPLEAMIESGDLQPAPADED